MKALRLSLLPRIIIAIALGIGLGLIVPDGVTRLFLTFNAIFSQFLDFAIPLIIVALVAEAIGGIGHSAGKMLLLQSSRAIWLISRGIPSSRSSSMRGK